MKKFKATITVRGWTDNPSVTNDADPIVVRCTIILTHIFSARNKIEAEILLKWFINHPDTGLEFQYHSIKSVLLTESYTDEIEGTSIEEPVVDMPIRNALGMQVIFNAGTLCLEEGNNKLKSGNYVVRSWEKDGVVIAQSLDCEKTFHVPLHALVVNGDASGIHDPRWTKLNPNELAYIAYTQVHPELKETLV